MGTTQTKQELDCYTNKPSSPVWEETPSSQARGVLLRKGVRWPGGGRGLYQSPYARSLFTWHFCTRMTSHGWSRCPRQLWTGSSHWVCQLHGSSPWPSFSGIFHPWRGRKLPSVSHSLQSWNQGFDCFISSLAWLVLVLFPSGGAFTDLVAVRLVEVTGDNGAWTPSFWPLIPPSTIAPWA